MLTAQLFLYGYATFYFILLNKFAVSQTYICAIENQEDKVTRITCPSISIISDVRFASYGNPEGSCGSYTVGSCHAPNSMKIVANECLNKTTCSLTPSSAIFDFNECHDEALQLYAEVLCSEYSTSPTVHPSGEELPVNVRDESTIEGMDTFCQSGWTYYYGKCYYFNFGTGYSWSGCNSICASQSASMLCISDSTTNSWIANKVYYNTAYYYSWIGYSDSNYDYTGYKWVSGCSSSYTNWNYYSYYYNYDYAYMHASSGTWYATSDTAYSNIACSCQSNAGSSSLDDDYYDDDDDSSSSAIAIIIIVAIVVGCCVCCCGPTIFGIYLFFVLSRNNNRVVTVDSDTTDTSNNQEYGNGNIVHTFPMTKINQEYGIISPSFPITTSNYGFPVATNVNNQEYGNISPSFPATSSNHGFPVATNVNNQEYGNISPSFPATSSNHGFHVANSSTQGYGYGNITTSYTS